MFLVGILFLSIYVPKPGMADCVDLGMFNRFYVQDDGKIIFYFNNVPLGVVELQGCTVNSSSQISLLKSSVCEGDAIVVDGESCTLLSVTID